MIKKIILVFSVVIILGCNLSTEQTAETFKDNKASIFDNAADYNQTIPGINTSRQDPEYETVYKVDGSLVYVQYWNYCNGWFNEGVTIYTPDWPPINKVLITLKKTSISLRGNGNNKILLNVSGIPTMSDEIQMIAIKFYDGTQKVFNVKIPIKIDNTAPIYLGQDNTGYPYVKFKFQDKNCGNISSARIDVVKFTWDDFLDEWKMTDLGSRSYTESFKCSNTVYYSASPIRATDGLGNTSTW